MEQLIINNLKDYSTIVIGNKKDLLTFKNADAINTTVFFSILFYNNFEVGYDIDANFWNAFLDFYNTSFNLNKKINFVGSSPIAKDKDGCHRIMYSKGKDSEFIKFLYPGIKTVQLYSTMASEKWANEVIWSNVDDLIWAKMRKPKNYKIELLLPIISPHMGNYIGVEKELWDNSILIYGFSMEKYFKLLNEFGIIASSPINHYSSLEITKTLFNAKKEYYKCNHTTEKKTDYCYHCAKCFILYFSGADESIGFNRKRVEQIFRIKKPLQLIPMLKKTGKGQIEKFESIYLQLYDTYF